jgi:hypothetical protein
MAWQALVVAAAYARWSDACRRGSQSDSELATSGTQPSLRGLTALVCANGVCMQGALARRLSVSACCLSDPVKGSDKVPTDEYDHVTGMEKYASILRCLSASEPPVLRRLRAPAWSARGVACGASCMRVCALRSATMRLKMQHAAHEPACHTSVHRLSTAQMFLHERASCRAELEGLKEGKDIFHEDWCALGALAACSQALPLCGLQIWAAGTALRPAAALGPAEEADGSAAAGRLRGGRTKATAL